MKLYRKFRNWLFRLVHGDLDRLKDGFLMIEADDPTGSDIGLSKMFLDSNKRLFRLRLIKTSSTSFTNLMNAPLRVIRNVLLGQTGKIPVQVAEQATEIFNRRSNTRMNKVLSGINERASEILATYNETYLRSFVRSDRNKFRQELLEKIAAQAGSVFLNIVQKRVAELVIRVRQETAVDDVPEVDTSGPLALPTGTRFFVRTSRRTVFVIEQPPQKRTIKLMDVAGTKSNVYQLSFPYVIFFVTLRGRKSDDMYVFFRNKPLRSLNDVLLRPALPNIFPDYHVCFSPSASKESLAIMAEESIANFWGGRFLATDASDHLTSQISIEEWAEKSKKDALFGSSHRWTITHLTVNSMLKDINESLERDQGDQSGRQKNTKIMSALDQAITSLVTTVTNDMKETTFNMVQNWKIDETLLSEVVAAFAVSTRSIGDILRSEFKKEAATVLSEDTMKKILGKALENVTSELDSLNADALLQARQEFEKYIRTTDDTNRT